MIAYNYLYIVFLLYFFYSIGYVISYFDIRSFMAYGSNQLFEIPSLNLIDDLILLNILLKINYVVIF